MDMGLCMHVCIFVKYSSKLVLNLNLNLIIGNYQKYNQQKQNPNISVHIQT